ncbi:potassium transporter Trk [Acrocarpospora corrugata]|uniref:Potassium transporter Trk n=1 Tax=Acrocarpospora corrugata TaxID=35763 RepID=A0A5M3WB86_9ACTN|nr:potassium transporter TrkG [Acrocarpospora corrugata]GES06076.1 potassium transporter Trk [Acrocarpospora corrugata]
MATSAADLLFRHPARAVVIGFALMVAAGTAGLTLPVATTSGASAGWVTALFTATSAVCVTGLVTVDTDAHWSVSGEVLITLLIQAGGLGIMTLATLLTLTVSRRLGLRTKLAAQAETKTLTMTSLPHIVRNIVLFSLTCEALAAAVLTSRFILGYGQPPGRALYLGVFHAVSAFNNAGFALWPDNLMRFAGDPWICLTIAAASIVGGLGFPVIFELLRGRRCRHWTMLTRITVAATGILLAAGTVAFLAAEWDNPKTLGPLDDGGKLLAALFTAVMPRTAGFNSLDISQMTHSSWLATDVLMFIGGGSAGTAGGIKVTTFAMLAFIVWTQFRGETHVNIGYRRLPADTQRQAVVITMLSGGLVAAATYTLLLLSPHPLDQALFETVSAFATVGLSTGITADLPAAGQLLLVALMFAGRVGPLTLGSALALKTRARRYDLPEEQVIVG